MKKIIFGRGIPVVNIFFSLMLALLMTLPMATKAMVLNNPPVANAGEDQTIIVNTPTMLHGTAIDPDGDVIVGWLWAVESAPGGSSPHIFWPEQRDPDFMADLPGDYVLSLIAFDDNDWSAPDFVTIHVRELLPPHAIIDVDVTSGPAPLTVQFDASRSTVDPLGAPLAYDWNFGDTYFSTEVSPSHIYEYPGAYHTILIVIDSLGQADQDAVEITVIAANNSPSASPTAIPNTGTAPLTVQFNANASDPDGDDLTYLWDFGDPDSVDNTSTLPDPQHLYEVLGTYVVWLTVSDGSLDVSESLTIVVDPAIGMTVRSAEVKFKGPHSTMGKVELLAAFLMDVPAPGEVVSLTFDGIELFSVPFMGFEPSNNNPNVYKLQYKNLFVMLDFDMNLLTVICGKLDLAALDNTNGVDVELQVGSAAAIENITLLPAKGNKLEYHSTE